MCRSAADGGRRCVHYRRARTVDLNSLRPQGNDQVPPVVWGAATTEQLYERYSEDVAATAIMELERIVGVERSITDEMLIALPDGSRLHGLELRMKSPSSLAAKIDTKLRFAATRPGAEASAAAVAAKLTDLIRYTVVSPATDNVLVDMRATLTALASHGWKVKELEHTFTPGNPYKGIHVLIERGAGDDSHIVELQFHTEEGIALKDHFHVDYEIMRDPGQPAAARVAAFYRMSDAWDQIPTAPGLADFTFGSMTISAKPAYPAPGSPSN